MRVREPHALAGEPVEIWCGNLRLRVVAADIAVTEIVREDEDDVGLRLRLRGIAGMKGRNPERHCGEKDGGSGGEFHSAGFYSMTTTGFPSTSILGVMPRPGAVLADMKPFCRCGAPSAVLTVT